MNRTLLASLFGAGILVAAQANALASDGTITFTGNIESDTCVVSVNGGSGTATVTLPTVSNRLLSETGLTAGNTKFSINLTKCSNEGAVYAYFEQGANVDAVSGKLINQSGTAANVVVQLKDSNNGVINIGSDAQKTAPVSQKLDADGAAQLFYSAEYFATGAAGAGTVSTSVTYSISYI